LIVRDEDAISVPPYYCCPSIPERQSLPPSTPRLPIASGRFLWRPRGRCRLGRSCPLGKILLVIGLLNGQVAILLKRLQRASELLSPLRCEIGKLIDIGELHTGLQETHGAAFTEAFPLENVPGGNCYAPRLATIGNYMNVNHLNLLPLASIGVAALAALVDQYVALLSVVTNLVHLNPVVRTAMLAQ
jgi:hypothetical protein